MNADLKLALSLSETLQPKKRKEIVFLVAVPPGIKAIRMNNPKNITIVKAGDMIRVAPVKVAPKCPLDGPENGHWYCVNHHQHFENQLEKDFHISKGRHHMAWICNEHGMEEP